MKRMKRMKRIKRMKRMKNSVSQNIILNIVKQLSTIVFPLIIFPYVSRVLQAENYGKENFSYSIISYFMLIAAMGIGSYAIREGARVRSNKKEFQLFTNQIFTINLITTCISFILLILLVLFWKKLHAYWMILFIHSLGIFITTVGADWINTIFEDFLYISIRYIAIQIIAMIAMFIFVKSPNDYIIYAAIHMFANTGANIVNIIYIRKYVHLKITIHPNIKKHIKPLFILFCNALSVQLYINSDITMLGIFQGDIVVGIYSVAVKIYIIIKQLLNAVITVIIPRVSVLLAAHNEKEYNRLLDKTFHTVISLLLPAITGILMLSREIVMLIAGKHYEEGHWALKILSIALIGAVFSNFYCNAILIPNRKEKHFLLATVVAASVNIGINILLIPRWSYVGAALTTVLAEFIVLLYGVHYSKNLYKFTINRRDITSCFLGCALIAILCIGVQNIVKNCLGCVIICVLSSLVIYFLTLSLLNNRVMQYIVNFLYKYK